MKRSILMLEHDDDDRYITQAVFDEHNYPVKLHFVDSSNDLFAFLISCEKTYTPYPSLILLNHYTKPTSAVDILRDLKADPRYSRIPTVVLSGTVNADILQACYNAGANSFIKKPDSNAEIHRKISTFVKYWFETVELP